MEESTREDEKKMMRPIRKLKSKNEFTVGEEKPRKVGKISEMIQQEKLGRLDDTDLNPSGSTHQQQQQQHKSPSYSSSSLTISSLIRRSLAATATAPVTTKPMKQHSPPPQSQNGLANNNNNQGYSGTGRKKIIDILTSQHDSTSLISLGWSKESISNLIGANSDNGTFNSFNISKF